MRPRLSTSAAEDDGDANDDCNTPATTLGATDGSSVLRNGAGAKSSFKREDTPDTANTASLLNVRAHTRGSFDRRSSIDVPVSARSRRSSSTSWRSSGSTNAAPLINGSSKTDPLNQAVISIAPVDSPDDDDKMPPQFNGRRSRFRSIWSNSFLTMSITALAILTIGIIVHSFTTLQLDEKGCRMSYMRPAFAKLEDFDTEHTRFASKYSVYLYREVMVDEDTRVKGVPVLFIPGNAGSYKQVRPIAAEAATYFYDVLNHDEAILKAGTRNLDFFTVDFNEEFTAFHGQAILDQAEYLNEAVAYILSLYHDPRRSDRDLDLPDPTSVIILGHSMGGIVARTMLVMPNYQSNSINTIITMSAPHARPPVSFDAQIVDIYEKTNAHWRNSYSQKWANNNPLWHVTLISFAGGGLDTMVPSDYTSLESLVPETHGFTVYTSTMPNVWTGMDHQAILWCDQFRKVLVKALYDAVDVNRPAQTKSRADRMRIFKKWFLTGMEAFVAKTLPQKEPTTLLTLEDNANSILAQGEKLTLRKLGQSNKPEAHLLPIPTDADGMRFTLFTDQKLDEAGQHGSLEVLFCSVFPLQAGQSAALLSMNMDLSGDSTGSTRLACKNAASDVIAVPASTRTSKHPFVKQDEVGSVTPFSYLEYEISDIGDHQFVAIVDKASEPTNGWVIAEFSENEESKRIRPLSLRRLLSFGMMIVLPPVRPTVMEVKIPVLHSSLLSFNLKVGNQACGDEGQLFTPLIRQYIAEPYESKWFVNVKQANINLHGIAPFMPPPLTGHERHDGVSLQIFTDPTCESTVEISLRIDVLGSFGKLLMRYRTIIAAFPLLIVALVIGKQFKVYNETGIFVSFAESMDRSLRRTIPLVVGVLCLMSWYLSSSSVAPISPNSNDLNWKNNGTVSAVDFKKNDLLLGSRDPFFWFLVPLMSIISVGMCVVMNYMALIIIQICSALFALVRTKPAFLGKKGHKRRLSAPAFCPSSTRRRLITTGVLLFLVSTFIPYQFAYLVCVLVQIATCTRAWRLATDIKSIHNQNFYNYVHSIFILMLWTIPAINLPILIVWVHNLAVQWLTPFSSHHNVIAVMPFILLVETLTSGKMVPRVTNRLRFILPWLFSIIAIYAAVYGVTYVYMLHHLVNLAVFTLVIVHSTASRWTDMFETEEAAGREKRGKTP